MKLEINQFIRTKSGKIAKIIGKIDNSGSIHENNIVYKLDDNSLLALNSKKVIKASHNIIDLIEVGDYVNGELVQDITGEYIRIGNVSHNKSWLSNNIKTILTKEQFENNCYKIGDE